MPLTQFVGFETSNSQEAYSVTGTPIYGDNRSNCIYGTHTLNWFTTGAYTFDINPNDVSGTHFAGGFYVNAFASSYEVTNKIFEIQDSSGTRIWSINMSTSRALSVVGVTSGLGNLNYSLGEDTWTKIEFRYSHQQIAPYLYIYVNGTLKFTYLSSDIYTDGSTKYISLIDSWGSFGETVFFDDPYVWTGTSQFSASILFGVQGKEWEVSNYFQPSTTSATKTGTTPAVGSVENLGENPVNETNEAEWTGSTDDADWAASSAVGASYSGHTIVAGKYWYRADRDGGGGTNHYLQTGKYASSTWTHTENLISVGTSPDDYWMFPTTNNPANSQYMAWGIRVDGAQDLHIYETGGWLLVSYTLGTNYQRSISDSVGITDVLSKILGRTTTITDSIGITDTINLVMALRRTFPESVGVTDTVTTSRSIVKTILDSIGITDIISAVKGALAKYATITDTVGITDSLLKARGLYRTFANSVGVTDNLLNIRALRKIFSNGIGVTDTLSTARDIVRSIADNVGITDVVTRLIKLVVSLVDSIGITDTQTTARNLKRSKADSVGVTDAITTTRNIVKSITDAVGVTDALTTARDIVISLADSIGITDVITAIKGALAKYVTIQDSVGVTDTVSTVRNLKITFAEALGVTDEIFTARDIKTLFAEAVGITDTVTGYRKILVALADTVGITDTISTVVTFVAQKVLKTIISTLGIIAVVTTQEE